MKSSITQYLKYQIVEDIHDDMLAKDANTYISIGRPLRWGNDSNETTAEIESVEDNLNYYFQIYRDMVAMKKVQASDLSLVVPRVDWAASTKYSTYADHVSLFTHDSVFSIGAANTTLNGTTATLVNSTLLTGNLSVGNTITIGTDTKEVTALNIGAGTVTVNTGFSASLVQNTLSRVDNMYPRFARTFYVRNSKDQIFKCLDNNNNGTSTIEPTIDIDGQLPENPYIEPGDGYKWKYLYTIPYGLKQKFFTKEWMPVITDTSIASAAVDGRIDIINITSGGSGYYLDGQSGNSNSLPIITVVGDGFDADITAKVQNGVITGLNILDGGKNYTTAYITVTDNTQLVTGTPAAFDVVISPKGGHGFNPAKELGCYSIMISTELVGTEGGTIPVDSFSGNFDFRQIALIRDPELSNGLAANGMSYATATKLLLSSPGITNYVNDEIITDNAPNSVFSAVVVGWDSSTSELLINNISGLPTVGYQIAGATSGAVATLLNSYAPSIKLFTGDLLYIENRQKIVRNSEQSEQIRLTLSF